MNDLELIGFLKQASANNIPVEGVAYLFKQATGLDADPQALQQLMAEASKGAPGAMGGMGDMPPMPGHGGGGADQALPHQELGQLHSEFPDISEEELAQLATEIQSFLAQQGGGAPGAPGADSIPLSAGEQNPVSAQEVGGATKTSSYDEGLSVVKSASYIFGFLKSAVEHGYDVRTAVDLYGDAYADTVDAIKQAQAHDEFVGQIAGGIDEKTASYCEGVVESAQSRGLSFEDTVALLKSAGVLDEIVSNVHSSIK